MKYFMWRTIWIILPTTDNLEVRGVHSAHEESKLNLFSINFLIVNLAEGYGTEYVHGF